MNTKGTRVLLAFLPATLVSLGGCIPAVVIPPAHPHLIASGTERSLKGYELYSWADSTGTWQFSLLPGTNRIKTPAEIFASPGKTDSITALKGLLAKLAPGESIVWLPYPPGAGPSSPFAMPSQSVISQIQQFSDANSLTFRVERK